MIKKFIHVSKFYYKAALGMSRKQRLRLPDRALSFVGKFQLSQKNKLAWFKIFKVSSMQLHMPFSYFWPTAINQVMSLVNHLKLNHKNVFHLYQKFTFKNLSEVDSTHKMELKTHLEDIVLYKEKRAIIMLAATLSNLQGEIIVNCQGAMLVKNLKSTDAKKILNSSNHNHTDINHLSNLRERTAKLPSGPDSGSIYIPENFGVAFGRVSGDRNPVHTSSGIAKLFGYPKAFIQGMATLNLLVKFFANDCKKQIHQIEITFCNPIFVDQEIQINFTDKEYEIIDSRGKLTAFGTYG